MHVWLSGTHGRAAREDSRRLIFVWANPFAPPDAATGADPERYRDYLRDLYRQQPRLFTDWAKDAAERDVTLLGDDSLMAVLYDALQAASSQHTDYVIVDTAGRLHTKTNLMAELEKMRRTAQRIIPGAPHETLLVMDATTGQNGLQQARQFTQSAGVTGIVLTKLDGTAKGGVVVAISREMGVPVRYVGVGEKVGDLLPFDPKDFVDSLFA